MNDVKEDALIAKSQEVRKVVDDIDPTYQRMWKKLPLPYRISKQYPDPEAKILCFKTSEGDFSDIGQALLHHVAGPAKRITTFFVQINGYRKKEQDVATPKKIQETEQTIAGEVSKIILERDYLTRLMSVLNNPTYKCEDIAPVTVIPLLQRGLEQLSQLQDTLETWCKSKNMNVEQLRAARKK